jgi:two-component system sensor histidine kinase HydH
MDLLKQTALILGLASLSIGGWTLFRNWQKKIAIRFFVVCLVVTIWSLSFALHVTLHDRLSYDVHRFFNIWLAPVGVMLLEQLLVSSDLFSKIIKWIAWGGAIVLSVMVSFSLDAKYDGSWVFVKLVQYWPSMIFFQFLNILYLDVIRNKVVSLEFITQEKRAAIYLGLAISLVTCTFDHVPEFGHVIPSIGNLMFTGYLTFASLVIFPQKLLRVDAMLSRFFATLILALVITGFFALIYQYVSDSFPLFLLNSFLVSFASLVLWNPLVALFRYLGKILNSTILPDQFSAFLGALQKIENEQQLIQLITVNMKQWLQVDDLKLVFFEGSAADEMLPSEVRSFFVPPKNKEMNILHRYLLEIERDQVVMGSQQQSTEKLIEYLDQAQCDLVFPILWQGKIKGIVQVQLQTTADEWLLGLNVYAEIDRVLKEVPLVLQRLSQMQEVKENERLATLGEMAAGLAHEIRNPLGAIQGACTLLDKNAGPWVSVIESEVRRLNHLVSQFLDLSHSSQEQPENVDAVPILHTTIDLLQRSTAIPIQFIASESEVWVSVVPDHLRQVLMNLIQNAIQSIVAVSPAETNNQTKMRVEVRLQTQSALDSEMVQIKIVDHGIGMTDDQMQKIFQPFYTTFKNGTGLGLPICERLMRINQGSIRVHSRLGEGTVVTLMLVKGQPC